jgi:Holliday junction resolvase RusA-like endonuclease
MDAQFFAADVAVEPIPCPRPRIMSRGKFAHAYYPASYKKWRAQFLAALPPLPRQFTRRIELTAEFRITKARTSKLDTPKGDIDNYLKALLDSLTDAGLWVDDKQVVLIGASKRFCNPGETAGIEVRVRETSWLTKSSLTFATS